MTPRTLLQNESIRKQKTEHIMNIALELFAEKGYLATSISEIATRAKISKGLLYNYFESKDRLLESIIHDGFIRIIGSFEANHDGILTREELIIFINNIVSLMQTDRQFLRLYMSLLLQPAVLDTKIQGKYLDKADYIFTMLKGYYVRKGSKDPDSDTYILHMIMDGVFYNYLYDNDFPIDKIKQMVIDRFL